MGCWGGSGISVGSEPPGHRKHPTDGTGGHRAVGTEGRGHRNGRLPAATGTGRCRAPCLSRDYLALPALPAPVLGLRDRWKGKLRVPAVGTGTPARSCLCPGAPLGAGRSRVGNGECPGALGFAAFGPEHDKPAPPGCIPALEREGWPRPEGKDPLWGHLEAPSSCRMVGGRREWRCRPTACPQPGPGTPKPALDWDLGSIPGALLAVPRGQPGV